MEKNTFQTLEWDGIRQELTEFCASSLGKLKAEKILPFTELEKIEYLQTKTSDAIELIRKFSFPPLFGIHEIKSILRRLKKNAILENFELLHISATLRVSQALKDYVNKDDIEKNIVSDQIDRLYTNTRIQKEIDRIIIDENTIADDASRTLFNIRKSIREKTEEARSKLNALVRDDTTNLQDGIVTMRDGRYVVPVKRGAKSKVPGIAHDISSTGQTVYIEPMVIVEINNKIRELEIQEVEEIRRILKELSEMVFTYHEEIENNQYLLVDLDFTFAKAKYALEKGYTRPILNADRIIDIKNAKHPLLKGNVVPINISIGENFRALIITGPNTGGKTVSLKTLGLVVLMAQSGLYIPAEEFSKVGIFNNIFTDIGDNQSIEQSLSTFSASMTNIVDILTKANENSLVLFDELGNGTDPVEGAALAMSIIDTLLDRNSTIVSTTHYSELKLYAMSTDQVQNANVEFNIETLSPTYKLIIGRPGKSNAFEISRRLGLSEEILNNASKYLSNENKDFEEIISEIENTKSELDRKIEELKLKEKEYNSLIEEFNNSVEKRRIKSEEEIEKNTKKANEILEDAIKESKEILKMAKSHSKNTNTSEIDRAYTNVSNRYREFSGKYNKSETVKERGKSELKVSLGETVKVNSMGGDLGIVQTLPDNKGDLMVQIGIMKFSVNLHDISKTKENIESEKSHSSYRKVLRSSFEKEIKMEIDLRGKNVDESIIELEEYFDLCILQGLKKVNVIHGKGTGALRSGLTEYFRKSRYVESFKMGDEKEGGAGVTVVTLR